MNEEINTNEEILDATETVETVDEAAGTVVAESPGSPEAEAELETEAAEESEDQDDPGEPAGEADLEAEAELETEAPGEPEDQDDPGEPAGEADLEAEAELETEAPGEPAGEADLEAEAELEAEADLETETPGEPEKADEPKPARPLADLEAFGDPDMAVAEEDDDGRAWYVVHCYSSYENKVRHNLEQRIESMGMKDRIFDVVVPVEEEIEVRDGRRRTIERRVFPGYILVNMILTEESWYVVRNTPGVTGFVGQGNTPIPLRPEEVAHIVKRMEAETPRIKVTFKSGERVRIIDGPFNDFRGTVAEIDMERAKVRVMVNFFGRETPVELDFLQVEKA